MIQWLFDDIQHAVCMGLIGFVFFCVTQFVFCLKFKRFLVKIIPTCFCISLLLFCVLMAFNVFDSVSSGPLSNLHNILAGFLGLIAGLFALGDAFAWGFYGVYIWFRLKK